MAPERALTVVQEARAALAAHDMVGKSEERVRSVHGGRVLDSEIAKLVTYFDSRSDISGYPMSDLTRFAVASCMRISEVCRLTWADLDEKAAAILIRNRKDPRKKVGNDQTVPLLGDALKIIKRQPRTEGEERIFPYSEKTVSTYFTRAVTALGLPDLHLHHLRHEGISRLFDAGLQIQQVAIVSGHKSWQMLRRYTKIQAADVHAAYKSGKANKRSRGRK